MTNYATTALLILIFISGCAFETRSVGSGNAAIDTENGVDLGGQNPAVPDGGVPDSVLPDMSAPSATAPDTSLPSTSSPSDSPDFVTVEPTCTPATERSSWSAVKSLY